MELLTKRERMLYVMGSLQTKLPDEMFKDGMSFSKFKSALQTDWLMKIDLDSDDYNKLVDDVNNGQFCEEYAFSYMQLLNRVIDVGKEVKNTLQKGEVIGLPSEDTSLE